ncbi:MAG TPA: NepR family anti-sigma factor [Methylomirabilota bacterium]|nr:NepR family anti-sigma factor [Methylomirabilota bacterium]
MAKVHLSSIESGHTIQQHPGRLVGRRTVTDENEAIDGVHYVSTNSDDTEPSPPTATSDSDKPEPLSADLQGHIGRRLKAYYDGVISEPIPERFTELLDRLDIETGGEETADVDLNEPSQWDATGTSGT